MWWGKENCKTKKIIHVSLIYQKTTKKEQCVFSLILGIIGLVRKPEESWVNPHYDKIKLPIYLSQKIAILRKSNFYTVWPTLRFPGNISLICATNIIYTDWHVNLAWISTFTFHRNTAGFKKMPYFVISIDVSLNCLNFEDRSIVFLIFFTFFTVSFHSHVPYPFQLSHIFVIQDCGGLSFTQRHSFLISISRSYFPLGFWKAYLPCHPNTDSNANYTLDFQDPELFLDLMRLSPLPSSRQLTTTHNLSFLFFPVLSCQIF